VTFNIKSLTDQSLTFQYTVGGSVETYTLAPRGRVSLEADHPDPFIRHLVTLGKISVNDSTGQVSPPYTPTINGYGLSWAGEWDDGFIYRKGQVVSSGGFTWVAIADASSNSAPALGDTRWAPLSILDTNVIFGVDTTTMTEGELVYRDTVGFASGLLTDLNISSLSLAKVTGLQAALDGKLSLSGGTVANLMLAAAPTSAGGAANKAYVDGFLSRAGGTMTGHILLPAGNPSNPLHAASKAYVDSMLVGGYLSVSGGTMTGPLVLWAEPSLSGHAANKAYVDRHLLKVGGTMTGQITLPANPTDAAHAARKAYVDLHLLKSGGTITGSLLLPEPASNAPGQTAVTKNYVDTQVSAGRAFTGKVSVPSDTEPTDPGDLITKQWFDDSNAAALLKSGGTMTGHIVLPVGNPSNARHATSKEYVDARTGLPTTGGTMTGAILGSHGLLQRSAGSTQGLTGELHLHTVTDLSGAPNEGLAFSSERATAVFRGRTVLTSGVKRTVFANYQVAAGDGLILADSGASVVVVSFGDPNLFPEAPITVRKVGQSNYAPVCLQLPNSGGRESLLTLCQNRESITLMPIDGTWEVITRSAPTERIFTVIPGAVTSGSGYQDVTFQIRDHDELFVACTITTTGTAGLYTAVVSGDSPWAVGDSVSISAESSTGYSGDYLVSAVSGGTISITNSSVTPSGGIVDAQISGVSRPLPTAGSSAVRACVVMASSSLESPWLAAPEVVLSIPVGSEAHPGGATTKAVRSDLNGEFRVRVTPSVAGARTLYLHILSAGILHGRIDGGKDTVVYDVQAYSSNIVSAASTVGGTIMTLGHNHGFVIGDVVAISGTTTTPTYNGNHTITAVSGAQITIAAAFVGSTAGTVVSNNAVALQVFNSSGFSGKFISVEGVSSLGSDNVAALVGGVLTGQIVIRSAFNSSLPRNGLVSILPVIPVTFPA